MQCVFLHSSKGPPDRELLPRFGPGLETETAQADTAQTDCARTKSAARNLLRRFCCVASCPAQEWRGAPGFALRYLFKMFLRQKLSRPARAVSHGNGGSDLRTDAWVLPPPHRALRSRTAPPGSTVPGIIDHRTCQERTVTSFPQPRPACSLPRDGPPESLLNRHGRSIRAGVRGVDKISLRLRPGLCAKPTRT
ncbi:hypothetical protein LAX5112_02283 [Roseibium alexandrii]|uniref:Uncharacterized protein n=1 Tax=Roseibium alexandrii TaxID=388408 RepID=A0A0M7A8B1_9HYPH|nr:hypothetical protein LAX5112_02283 [Roseibium alexandrii]